MPPRKRGRAKKNEDSAEAGEATSPVRKSARNAGKRGAAKQDGAAKDDSAKSDETSDKTGSTAVAIEGASNDDGPAVEGEAPSLPEQPGAPGNGASDSGVADNDVAHLPTAEPAQKPKDAAGSKKRKAHDAGGSEDQKQRKTRVNKKPKLALRPKNTLYLQNLNDKLPLDKLKQNLFVLFSTFGTVLNININTTAQSRRKMRGQAHVTMESVESAKRAKDAVQQMDFFGKPVKVEFAKEESAVLQPEFPAYAAEDDEDSDKA